MPAEYKSRTPAYRKRIRDAKLAEKAAKNPICDACGLAIVDQATYAKSTALPKYVHRNTEQAVKIAGVHFITLRIESNVEK